MFANSLARGPRRRGIVLVLILGMLGLLALIGVTFATFAGQSLVNARNFSLGENRPGADQFMDFALGQLINDTNNPLSAIRGHSLLRDMYGNDSVFRGTIGADVRGYLDRVTQANGTLATLQFFAARHYSAATHQLTPALNNRPQGYFQYLTNIPTARMSYQYYGLNFTRWVVKVPNLYNANGQLAQLSQTMEVLEDDDTGVDPFANSNGGYFHLLTLAPLDSSTYTYNNPAYTGYPGQSGTQTDKIQVPLTSYNPQNSPPPLLGQPPQVPLVGLSFTLDGRYMRAFNGPGLSRTIVPPTGTTLPMAPFNVAAYGNFKANGILTNPLYDPSIATNLATLGTAFGQALSTNYMPTAPTFGDPDLIGMDEDYDACDLENWFLAIQSADGQVMIPSFHRPSILTVLDWTSPLGSSNVATAMNAVAGVAKILRPRLIDNSPQFPPDPSVPDANGKLTYDVDNDGDGVTDSVWLDLGYPVQRDPGGKLYKPLFAFMVIGQNGRLPLNTVGNIQDRDNQYSKTYFATTTNGTSYIDPTGMVTGPTTMPPPSTTQQQFASCETFFDAPTWDHTSHVGASVNEINPRFALQNAPANVYNPNVGNANYTPTISDAYFSQVDNAGIDVSLTQLRNLLAGTVPMDSLTAPSNNNPQEGNFAYVNGQAWWMPNGVMDNYDPNFSNGIVYRTYVPPVPGRWGEPEGVPKYLTLANSVFSTANYIAPNYAPVYTNPVRSGRSFYAESVLSNANSFQPTGDAFDDDLDSYVPAIGTSVATGANEYAVAFDGAGQVALASQRLGRFLVPTDPSGNGQLVDWMSRPTDVYDHGTGYDKWGRVTYFRYFRPPGAPTGVGYPFALASQILPANSQYQVDAYKMPVLMAAAALGPVSLANPIPTSMLPNYTNNPYHAYEAFRAPAANSNAVTYGFKELSQVAVAGAMPFNVTGVTPNNSGIYPLWPVTATDPLPGPPTMAPYANTETGPWMFGYGPNITPDAPTINLPAIGPGFVDNANTQSANGQNTPLAVVANGYPLGSLNKDEADEMNLYTPNRYDQQFGPSDLEWLYRKQDVDGSTLSSRLSSLAPISFTNPMDGQTRRRLFSLESWEPNSFVWANDNPQGNFPYNSRFAPYGNSGFAGLNQVPLTSYATFTAAGNAGVGGTTYVNHMANPNTVEGIPNPTLEGITLPNAPPAYKGPFVATSGTPSPPATTAVATDPNLNPNPDVTSANYTPIEAQGQPVYTLPLLSNQLAGNSPSTFITATANTQSPFYPNLTNGLSSSSLSPVPTPTFPIATPSLALRDRRINLNMPLPIASDPAEPVRQKWVRDAYQLLKAILPPQAVDTPEELASLSQFCVNIIDFRDPDATMTRFVNTDLMVVPATSTTPAGVKFAEFEFPSPGSPAAITTVPNWDPYLLSNTYSYTFFPFDPAIALEQSNPSSGWVAAMTDTTGNRVRPLFLVQYGMEYNPIAINEVLAYSYNSQGSGGTPPNVATPRLYIELVNTLTDDTSHIPTISAASPPPPTPAVSTPAAGDLNLAGWDFIITPDTDAQGRPDPITGNIPALAGLVSASAYYNSNSGYDVTKAGAIDASGLQTTPGYSTAIPPTYQSGWGNNKPPAAVLPVNSFGWSLDPTNGLYLKPGANPAYPNGLISYVPALRSPGPLGNTNGSGYPTPTPTGTNPVQLIGDGYYVLGNPPPTGGGQDRKPVLGINPSTGTEYPPDFRLPNNFLLNNAVSTPQTSASTPPGNQFYWLYLRRPANPFNPSAEMVVVDSFRFAYIADPNTGQTTVTGTPPKPADTALSTVESGSGINGPEVFSLQRLQPYRGGHHVPSTPQSDQMGTPFPSPTQQSPMPNSVWGYTEQTATVPTSVNTSTATTQYGPNTPTFTTAGNVYSTIGAKNNPADTSWDFFPFHDRDFNSVAELLIVPGCPPGLFTKQFAEQNFNLSTTNATPPSFTYPINRMTDFTSDVPITPPHPYPYLNDEFYYTAVSVSPSTDSNDPASQAPYPTQIGGWTGAGWYKMFDFFEVPSSANGAIGTTDSGENFDWSRADRRPGLINLNLIMDEEVFFGLMDDQRLNVALAQYSYQANVLAAHYNVSNYGATLIPTLPPTLPQVVSQIDLYGNPTHASSISDPTLITQTYLVPGYLVNYNANNPYDFAQGNINNNVGRGFCYPDPAYSNLGALQPMITGMKSAFADFLKLRSGGTNFLFGHQAPYTTPGLFPPVWPDKPFRSLSYPDINYTVMRPASPTPTLNPTYFSYGLPLNNVQTFPPPYQYDLNPTVTGNSSPIQSTPKLHVGISASSSDSLPTTGYVYNGDPGVRYPWLDLTFTNITTGNYGVNYSTPLTTPMIPPIPPRRLFQPADVTSTSNASSQGDSTNLDSAGMFINYYLADPYSQLYVQKGPANGLMAPFYETTSTGFVPNPPNTTTNNPSQMVVNGNPYQGANFLQKDFLLTGNRQHPYYRTETLQKVLNLSTVRTHQFAVWITVGFFEVTHVGTPELGLPDILGAELDAAAGKNVRYRSFFVIDRTKATGFNPSYPGEFRDCVTYRRRIE